MTVYDLIKHIEDWAPPGAAWKKDNVGLQIGDGGSKVTNVLLALEVNLKVLQEAVKKNCNFIFTHHPFLFKPLKRLDFRNDAKAQIIKEAAANNITIFSAHTNLDFTAEGVSFELAKKLKLKNIEFLLNQESNQYKLIVFVPHNSLQKVSDAVFNAGAGIIGEYGKCSYRTEGEGTFEGSGNTNPAVGKKENFETVKEVRLEVLVDSWKINKVINEMISAHPYEEPAYDIYPLANRNVNYGMGTIGELENSLSKKDFLEHVIKSLNAKNLRYTNGKKNSIKRVAVCGGSGSELVNTAISLNADAFVTADIKYHTFQDAENKILLIDAGHYETEIHSLNVVKRKIEKLIKERSNNIKVYNYAGNTNPVNFYKT